jgi:ADP-ribose pyrophosphatase YjhB (NUDIX family)/GNAT superfamily N-acetyltransferase
MPIPEFVQVLRSHVGTDLLWMPGVSAVVRNARGEVLLVRRSDNGQWALVSGILEPGEQPAVGLAREIEEETGVVAEVEALTGVWTLPEVTYPNGDRAQYLDLCFLARHVSGEARVNDDESLEVGWFAAEELPDMPDRSRTRLERALAHDGSVWFEGARPPSGGVDGGTSSVELDTTGPVSLRRARRDDVPAIVALLADDVLGESREHADDLTPYLAAFARIDADPAHLLIVADAGGEVVGTLQLTVLPGLSRRGALRAQVEAVRVADSQRGQGLGQALLLWAVEESRARGCSVVQLTTDKQRIDAHRFYERLGFVASHEGMKLHLETA